MHRLILGCPAALLIRCIQLILEVLGVQSTQLDPLVQLDQWHQSLQFFRFQLHRLLLWVPLHLCLPKDQFHRCYLCFQPLLEYLRLQMLQFGHLIPLIPGRLCHLFHLQLLSHQQVQ